MSMESGSSNTSRRSRGQKGEKQRRSWTDHEEQVLLTLLKELMANGWKNDNGFKPRFLGKLEGEMKKAIPGCTLRGSPHINSKITIWKRQHSSLHTMIRGTGVGVDHVTHLIDATDSQWEKVVKGDPNAHPMRHKRWPMLEDWNEIFRKDRATGVSVEDVMDAVNEMLAEDVHPDADDSININAAGSPLRDMSVSSETVRSPLKKIYWTQTW